MDASTVYLQSMDETSERGGQVRNQLEDLGFVKGSKTKVTLPGGSDPLSPVELPAWAIDSGSDGPVLTVTAGVHGSEYASILAAISTFKELEVEDLKKGTLVVLPVVNPPGFAQRVPFVNPIDNVNLNRVFPGEPDGTITLRIVHDVFQKVLLNSDAVVDLHGGDLFERLLTHTKYFVSGVTDIDKKSKELARLITERYYQPVESGGGYLFSEVAKAGVPCAIVEAGGEGFFEKKDYEFHKRGIVNALRWLGMVEGECALEDEYEEVTEELRVRTDCGGFVFRHVNVGDKAEKGSVLAEVINVSGEVAQQLLCPADDCLVMYMNSRGVVNTGDTVFLLWKTVSREEK